MNCTLATELMRQFFSLDIDAFESAARSAGQGANGIVAVPYFSGERTPNLPNGRGCLFGLTPANLTRENMVRASIEGVTFALKSGVDRLRALGLSCNEIVLTGGGAQSALWRQMVADVFNAPVVTPLESEGAAFGAALQALHLVAGDAGFADIVDEHVRMDPEKACQPQPAAVATYNDLHADYERIAAAVYSVYKHATELSRGTEL